MYLFFDTETTGIPLRYNAPVTVLHNWPRVVQLAFLLTDPAGKPLASQQLLIKPEGFVIPDDAAQIHGITTAHALSHGLALRAALTEFLTSLESSTTLVAHNMSYDENVLGAEFLHKIPNPLPGKKRICTMQAATNFCVIAGKYGKFKWPTLSQLHQKLFQSDFKHSHSALGDVQACAKCFFELRTLRIIR